MSKNKENNLKQLKLKEQHKTYKTLKQNCFHKNLILNNNKIRQLITTDKQIHKEPVAKRII